MKILSVILPVYNVEKYVEKCIRSIEAQDILQNEYEIICVNDGSKDNSKKVIQTLFEEFDNIILINQENQGVSVARNKGLENAKGKYVLFIDPDDYISENILGSLINTIEEKELQMILPSIHFVDEKGNIMNDKIFKRSERILTGIEAYYIAREKKGIVVDSLVGILFRKEFLVNNNLKFTRNVVLNQDVELLARIHCIAKKCILTNEVLYKAVARQGSATRSNQSNTQRVRRGFIIAAKNLKEFQVSNSLSNEQKVFLNGPIAKFVLLALYSAARTKSYNTLKSTIKDIRLSGFKKLELKKCSRFNKVCGGAYNISPYFGALVTIIYQKINYMQYVRFK